MKGKALRRGRRRARDRTSGRPTVERYAADAEQCSDAPLTRRHLTSRGGREAAPATARRSSRPRAWGAIGWPDAPAVRACCSAATRPCQSPDRCPGHRVDRRCRPAATARCVAGRRTRRCRRYPPRPRQVGPPLRLAARRAGAMTAPRVTVAAARPGKIPDAPTRLHSVISPMARIRPLSACRVWKPAIPSLPRRYMRFPQPPIGLQPSMTWPAITRAAHMADHATAHNIGVFVEGLAHA